MIRLILAAACFLLAGAVFVTEVLGLFRFRYVLDRMHAAALGDTLGIFLVGAGIDSLRMRFVEEPFFRFWDRYWGSVTEKYRGLEKKLFQKLNIQD